MKTPFKVLLALTLLFGVERLIRIQTNGFRIQKTSADFPSNPDWEIPDWEIKGNCRVPDVLNQPYYFLGSGVQCYAFLSEDKTTVLKLFKHFHSGMSSTHLRKLPLPPLLDEMREEVLAKRKKRINAIFSSALLAYEKLSEQTGIFHINLNPKGEKYGILTLYDKIGIRYDIDLNTTPFVLQRKADLIFSYLENHPDQTPSVIDSLFSCIQNRNHLGIANSDPIIDRNFGVFEGKVVEIDVGSFFQNPYTKTPLYSKREIFHETLELKEWLKTHVPEMSDYFEAKLLQIIQT